MSTVEIKSSQIGVLADKTVIIKSQELSMELLRNQEGTLKDLKQQVPSLELSDLSIDIQGNLIIANEELVGKVLSTVNSNVAAAGDTNVGICF